MAVFADQLPTAVVAAEFVNHRRRGAAPGRPFNSHVLLPVRCSLSLPHTLPFAEEYASPDGKIFPDSFPQGESGIAESGYNHGMGITKERMAELRRYCERLPAPLVPSGELQDLIHAVEERDRFKAALERIVVWGCLHASAIAREALAGPSITLPDAAFDQFAEAIANPPEPTPALTKLMAEFDGQNHQTQ